jgi:hypothetical protein
MALSLASLRIPTVPFSSRVTAPRAHVVRAPAISRRNFVVRAEVSGKALSPANCRNPIFCCGTLLSACGMPVGVFEQETCYDAAISCNRVDCILLRYVIVIRVSAIVGAGRTCACSAGVFVLVSPGDIIAQ